VLTAGVKPSIDFLEGSGIEYTRMGINVNRKTETNVKDVYAVGDCSVTYSARTKKKTVMRLATTAYRQGIVAGINAAGGNMEYKGTLGTFVCVVKDMEIASTGLTAITAKENGYDVVIGRGKGYTKPHWVPGHSPLSVKLIVSKDGKILGGQAVGGEASKRINIISMAIRAGANIKQLADS